MDVHKDKSKCLAPSFIFKKSVKYSAVYLFYSYTVSTNCLLQRQMIFFVGGTILSLLLNELCIAIEVSVLLNTRANKKNVLNISHIKNHHCLRQRIPKVRTFVFIFPLSIPSKWSEELLLRLLPREMTKSSEQITTFSHSNYNIKVIL